MAIKQGKTDPVLAAARVASAKRLVARLEAAHQNGTLKPVNPNAQPITMEVRVKVTAR